MSFLCALLSALLLVGGATCLYLTTPHQRLLAAPLSARAMLIAVPGLAGALAILLGSMGPATAVFTWMIGLMMAWTIPPVVIGWLRYRRETRP